SCPTRRSSDLEIGVQAVGVLERNALLAFRPQRDRFGDDPRRAALFVVSGQEQAFVVANRQPLDVDVSGEVIIPAQIEGDGLADGAVTDNPAKLLQVTQTAHFYLAKKRRQRGNLHGEETAPDRCRKSLFAVSFRTESAPDRPRPESRQSR